MTDKTPKVRLRGLYKIFGPNHKDMMQHVRAGMGKPELLEQHKHVLGLQDINVDMQAGEITVVMGLSGSGKSTLIRHLNRLIDPTAGEIIVDGIDVMGLSDDVLRKMRQKRCRWCSKSLRFCRIGRCCRTPQWRSKCKALTKRHAQPRA